MSEAGRYDLLFESVRIGPVTAPNRFYQVPHCTGMGYARPQTLAAMRGMKAEGGWGVVCTEYCSIDQSSDDTPYPYATIWDEDDVRNLSLMADAVHEHGALAGLELWHGGSYVSNLLTRAPTLGVRSMPSRTDPVQSMPMDRSDIRALRASHRAAALRARDAGFDVVYVYPTHGYLLAEFLSRSLNTRTDEYGGSLENRARLVRELIEETCEAVGDRCAVAVRMSADGHGENHLDADEARDLIGMLGPLPDLWDLVVAEYDDEMGSSRFTREGALEESVAYVRALTGKPVVSVGRFTSPDTMLSQVRRGVVDFVGAARPSIADPFLPTKVREGRGEDIRECIGCNICYAGNTRGAPIRCTQNPTMGEEWRRGWHPERIDAAGEGTVLIVGAGPAGLEAAHVLGRRGFTVSLADKAGEPGGRVTRESRLPGLAEWARVRDYRLGQFTRLPNVSLYLGSEMSAADVAEFGADHVLIATGARWRRDGTGRWHQAPVPSLDVAGVLTPDDIMEGTVADGRIVLFDDDHYYMGPVLAEQLVASGARVTYVTTEGRAGSWSHATQELVPTQRRLIALGVEIVVSKAVSGFDGEAATLDCVYSDGQSRIAADAIVLVTSREPEDSLYHALKRDRALTGTLHRIGDCGQPSIIAAAVYSGHKAGRELGPGTAPPSLRDRVVVVPA
ncbi:FAD-dependent oxidoreductase [Microbaculum marinum]|uniref:FAD-dependent oxidoreductase n=1 Tax=Microbaculum marinum TaxID=1764581 RepID=A0AAW9RSS6_9HYPH